MRTLLQAFVAACFTMLTTVDAAGSAVGNETLDCQIGWRPTPTAAVDLPFHDWLNKRQYDAPTSVCGYIASDNSLTCSAYCGFATASRAFGCCQSVVTTGPSTALTACGFFSACNDYSLGCDDSCSSNIRLQACTDTAEPYCVLYSRVGDGFTLTNWGCSATPGLTIQISASLTTPASVVPSTTASTTSTGSSASNEPGSSSVQVSSATQSVSSATMSITSTSEAIVSSTPFSQSQPSASNGVPVVTVTAAGSRQIPSSSAAILMCLLVQLVVVRR